MGSEEEHFLCGRVAGLAGLLFGDLRADADIPQSSRGRGVFGGTRAEFVHRKAHDVCGAFKVQPAHVKFFHGFGVDEDDVEFDLG